MKKRNFKYGLLISAATLFGGGAFNLYAQTEAQADSVRLPDDYKKQLFKTTTAENPTVTVDFVVDSICNKLQNGDLIRDVNVIEILASLDEPKASVVDSLNNRYIAAHELWHRVALASGVLEKPMSASFYRTGRDNFEISAGIVSLLTFRYDYRNASTEEREQMESLSDPKIRMYVQAVKFGLINPFSDRRADFDQEMAFIAKMVSTFWNKNMAPQYAGVHDQMTEKTGRKEFYAPAYRRNFLDDIKTLNTIGGIDFSLVYDFDIHSFSHRFEAGNVEDTLVIKQELNEPDYEAWVETYSRLKRYSRQQVTLPNFKSPLLAEERKHRTARGGLSSDYALLPESRGYKTYPLAKIPFYAAATFANDSLTFKLYPNGSVDRIEKPDVNGCAQMTSFNFDGSYETGFLLDGRKQGTFTYFDANDEELSRCDFDNGRAQNGTMIMATDTAYINYIYSDGELTDIVTAYKKQPLLAEDTCSITKGMPADGIVPIPSLSGYQPFVFYKEALPTASFLFTPEGKLVQRTYATEDKAVWERFYDNETIKYRALLPLSEKDSFSEVLNHSLTPALPPKKAVREEALYDSSGRSVAQQVYTDSEKSLKVRFKEFIQMLMAMKLPTDEIKAVHHFVKTEFRPASPKPQKTQPYPRQDLMMPPEVMTISSLKHKKRGR